MRSDQRPGKHARSRLAGWTWPRGILTAVAVLANLAFLGLLYLAVGEASPHTRALDDDVAWECLVRGTEHSLLTADVEVSFERPWVLRLEDRAPGGRALLCEYASGNDDQPHRVVRVWAVP